MGFRATVVAGVLSTLIAAFISWLFGFWHTAWSWLGAAANTFWSIFTYDVPVPIGVLALLGIALLSSFARLPTSEHRPISSDVPTNNFSTKQIEQNLQVLSENELKVVRLLAEADGQWAKLSDIASDIRLSRLVTEQALEKLLEKGFLKDSHNYTRGTSFRLSSIGRDYAIEQGLVR